MDWSMDKDLCIKKMEMSFKGSFIRIKHMEVDHWSKEIKKNITESLQTELLKEMESIIIQTVINTLEGL